MIEEEKMKIQITKLEGPLVDKETYQPYLRVTMNIGLSLVKGMSEEEQALVFYKAWLEACEEYK